MEKIHTIAQQADFLGRISTNAGSKTQYRKYSYISAKLVHYGSVKRRRRLNAALYRRVNIDARSHSLDLAHTCRTRLSWKLDRGRTETGQRVILTVQLAGIP